MDVGGYLEKHGPCTGAELQKGTAMEAFRLWQVCCAQENLVTRRTGRRYLRLDRTVEGYGRLSPSMCREFLTYTVVGVTGQEDEITRRCAEREQEFLQTSRRKWRLARETVQRIVEASGSPERLQGYFCSMIAGDVTYAMAHTVERPEPSTGRPVCGSDLDVVVVCEEEATVEEREAFDRGLYREKWRLLVWPDCREEIDYVVKDMATVMEQLQFDDFRHMVACKILHESEFLYGNAELFGRVKQLLRDYGVPEKLAVLEGEAIRQREIVEEQLERYTAMDEVLAWQRLFFTHEEREEIC